MQKALVLTVLLLGGCVSRPIVTAASSSCAVLVPTSWVEGVPPPPMPADDSVGSWISFGDAAIGKLDQANSRTRDSIEIVTKCEARDAEARKRAARGWLGRLFG